MNPGNSISQTRAVWQDMCQLYPFYIALNERFNLGISLCDELEQENPNPNLDQVTVAHQWFEQIDTKVAVFHIRQLMHSGAPLPEPKLRNLLLRHLHRLEKSEQLREKLDFLLVQYYAQAAGPKIHPEEMTFDDVAQALRPVFGEVAPEKFPWIEELQGLSRELLRYKGLKDLLQGGLLDRGRAVKRTIDKEYFQPAALVAITQFNFVLRAGFFRLMHADIEAIGNILNQLRLAGVHAVDVSRAELSAQEPLDSLKAICHEWKRRLRADYQLGNSFQQLVLVREACEQALSSVKGEAAAKSKVAVPPTVKADPKPEAKTPAAQPAKQLAAPASGPSKANRVAVASKAPAPASQPAAQKRPNTADAAASASAKAAQTPAPATTQNPIAPSSATAKAPQPTAQKKAATSAAASAAPAKASPAVAPQKAANPAAAVNVGESLKQIKTQLEAKKGTSASSVVLAGTKMMLATWEVEAFMQNGNGASGNGVSETLQRAVTARSLMAAALDGFKKKQACDLPGTLAVARNEVSRLNAEIEQAKERKDLDAAVNLAATGKRLSGLISEAEGLIK